MIVRLEPEELDIEPSEKVTELPLASVTLCKPDARVDDVDRAVAGGVFPLGGVVDLLRSTDR